MQHGYPEFGPDLTAEVERRTNRYLALQGLKQAPTSSYEAHKAILYGFLVGCMAMLAVGIPGIFFGIAGIVAATAAMITGFILAKIDGWLRCGKI